MRFSSRRRGPARGPGPPSLRALALVLCGLLSLADAGETPFRVRFAGNQELRDARLARIVERPEYQAYSPYMLEEIAHAVRDLYHAEGYAEVVVAASETARNGERLLTVEIAEGRRYRVGRVEIAGASHYAVAELERLLAQRPGRWRARPFDRVQLAHDRRRLADFHRARGFLDVRVAGREELDASRGRAHLYHEIAEGTRYHLSRVEFFGHAALAEQELAELADLPSDAPYSPISADAARARLLDAYRNRGYPYAGVDLTIELDREQHLAAAAFSITEGTRVRVAEVRIEGYRRTRPEVIERRVRVQAGEDYSRRQWFETRRDVFALGLFSAVDVEPASPLVGQATTDAVVRVEEGKFARLRAGLGYGTLEGPRASLEASYTNLFGRAHTLGLLGETSGIGNSESLYYQVPGFMGTEYDLRSELFHTLKEEPSFDVERVGGSLLLSRRLDPLWRLSWRYGLEDVRLSNVARRPTLSELRRSEGILSHFRGALSRDDRDRPLDPHAGSLSRLELGIAGGPLLGDFDFLSAELSHAHFLPVTDRSTLALYGELGWLSPYGGSSQTPLGERFLLGGDDTLRGFERDKVGPRDAEGRYLGGDALLLLSAEYRFPLYKRLQGAVFYDTGNVWEDWSDADMGELRSAAGAGLRFITPVAAIRVDWAVNLDPRGGEEESRIHFSIGHAF